jgi:hypothetical protein
MFFFILNAIAEKKTIERFLSSIKLHFNFISTTFYRRKAWFQPVFFLRLNLIFISNFLRITANCMIDQFSLLFWHSVFLSLTKNRRRSVFLFKVHSSCSIKNNIDQSKLFRNWSSNCTKKCIQVLHTILLATKF